MNAAPPTRRRLVPQAGPSAWRADALGPADYMVPLGAEAAADLDAALAARDGRAPESAADAPLPRLGPVLREAASRLETGRGFVLLRGLSLDRIGDAPGVQEALLRTIGVHLGRALPQGPGGELVGRLSSPVSGLGPGNGELRDRLYWRFHADPCDIVALLNLHQPPEADPAMLVSAATVHNELMRRDRAALEELYGPLPHAQPGQKAPVALPVFSLASGAFIGRYARDSIEAAQRLPETPRLTAKQVVALDLLDAICAEPGLALRIEARPGDVLLFNPLMVWKRRAEVAEGPVPEPPPAAREALRLWLLAETSRALPGGLAAVQGGADSLAGEAGGMVGG
jgi:hypothetical protein